MMIWKTFLARFLAAPTLDLKTQHGSGVRSEVQRDPAVAIMSRLGLARVTIIATICSALLSMLVAWVLGFFIPVPNYNVHILLAFLISFFVTPVFSYFTALSMRELKRARARSRQLADDADREREHLQAAVNNMPIGLVMFGADKRLIVGNDPYREMYGLPAEVMRRGTHLRDMLAQRLSAGSFEGAGDSDYIERILKLVEQTESTARRVELGDGRIFNILHHPIPGGGWIGTHEDATDREKLNARLANQNELLRAREYQLETQNLLFDAALENMSQGLCMFDRDHRLVLRNEQYLRMYGLAAEDVAPGLEFRSLLGLRVAADTYPKGPDPDAYVANLRQSLADHTVWRKVTELPGGRFISVENRVMANGGWLATHEDVTELRRAEAQLLAARAAAEIAAQEARDAHATLLDAFEVIPEGLVLFDAQDRLVLWNKRYAEIYDPSGDRFAVGMRFEDLLRDGLARGQYPEAKGCEDAWLADRLARHAQPQNTHELRLPKERWVRIREQRTANGGSIGVRMDISELKWREAALQAQNMRFDAALNNMSHGLCMFDHEQRLVVCNEQFAQIYDLPAELITAGTTLQQIVRHRVHSGLYAPDDPNNQTDLFEIVRANVPVTRITELTDGRAILIKHRPMPGGGFVATHEDITEQRNIEARINHMAHHDALTDLPNRVLLQQRLAHVLSQNEKAGPVAVLWLDLDRFKGVNDTLGHTTGDALLKAVAHRLQGCVREDDTVARMGGDEFALIQCGTDQPVGATTLALRLIDAISAPFQINGHQIVVGTSIGISVSPFDARDSEVLLKNADLAMYRAKNDGRGTYRFFEPGMDARMHARRKLELDLRNAVANGGFELFYQPIVELEHNEISTFEALLRWNHPERGRISPAEFIPLAEETGLIASIGEWVLRAACAQAATWPERIKVAVNLSALQFKQCDVVELVINTLATTALCANRLELEITESILLENTEATLATLHKLRDLGVRISMDDFGTGYSSLSNLRSFPFDKIKVDQSFTHGLGGDGQCATIMQAVAALGAGLGMATIAEGVETADQLMWVRTIGINAVQGYYLGRPVPAFDIPAVLAKFRRSSSVAA